MNDTIPVPYDKLQEMYEHVSCQSISEHRRISGSVMYLNVEYVIVSSMSSGARGCSMVDGYRAVSLATYKLNPELYQHPERDLARARNEQHRGYDGDIVRHRDRQLIMYGNRLTFTPTNYGRQLSLFK